MNSSPLGDDFFRLGHTDYTGALLVDRDALAIGLAAALLGELAWSGSIALADGLVMPVRDGAPPADAAVHAVFDDIQGEPKLHEVPTWLRYLALKSYDRVLQRLIAGNHLVAREVRGLFRRRIQYEPTDPSRHAMARARLTTGLAHRRPLHDQDVYLLGIADAAGLLPSIVDWGGHPAHTYYNQLVADVHPDIQALIQQTKTLIGTKVMSRR